MMSARIKLLIGLAAALLAGWVSHGPLGRGEAFIGRLEAEARSELQEAEMNEIAVVMEREPLRRVAILSGEASDFQREGQGLFPGINDRIAAIPGMAGFEWVGRPAGGKLTLPLLAETLILCAIAWLIGLGIGRLLFGRRRRQSYLD